MADADAKKQRYYRVIKYVFLLDTVILFLKKLNEIKILIIQIISK